MKAIVYSVQKMKEKIRKKYYRKIRMVLKSELNAINKIEAIKTVAILVILQFFQLLRSELSERAAT